jgi:hypothetical protein
VKEAQNYDLRQGSVQREDDTVRAEQKISEFGVTSDGMRIVRAPLWHFLQRIKRLKSRDHQR